MLPMLYRPNADGEVLPRRLDPPVPPPDQLPIWRRAALLAESFWRSASADARISAQLRAEASRVLAALQSLLRHFG